MPSFEEEALRRARQLNNSRPQQKKAEAVITEPAKNTEQEQKPCETHEKEQTHSKGQGVMDVLMSDKEQSLILLLILLLSGEHADPTLLLALMYILM
ncbi:MAG: hypothetical protein UH080_04185 [Ruminococcus sp.]|nr:hypothetical protein [Ruminococcus sp.]